MRKVWPRAPGEGEKEAQTNLHSQYDTGACEHKLYWGDLRGFLEEVASELGLRDGRQGGGRPSRLREEFGPSWFSECEGSPQDCKSHSG